MTLSSSTNRNDYTGTGATSTYSYTFKIFLNSDLLVTQRNTSGAEATLVLNTDYTVSGAGAENGGSITLLGGNLATGYTLTIRRVRPLTQATDIRNQGEFFPEVHEDAFDHNVMIAQQLDDVLDRSVTLPETVPNSVFNPQLPSDTAGAIGKAPVTNASGNGWAVASSWPSATDIANASGYAAAAAASASQASAFPAINQPYGINNIAFTTSVAASALTIALKQADGSTNHSAAAGSTGTIRFRSATLTSGAYIERSITSAISLTVSSGATLGHNDGAAEYIYVYLLDNAGTVELAVCSSNHRSELDVVSTTVMSSTSDDGAVMYSASARSNVPFRLIGIIKVTEATAGTWASNATIIAPRVNFQTDFVVSKSANFIPKHGFTYEVDTSSARSVQLPAPSANWWTFVHDKSGLAGTNNITLLRAGGELINGVASNYALSKNFFGWKIYSDGVNYFVADIVSSSLSNVSYTSFEAPTSGSDSLTLNAWTAFPLSATSSTFSSGTVVTKSVNDLTFPFTGRYEVRVFINNWTASGNTPSSGLRFRNTTDSTTQDVAIGTDATVPSAKLQTVVMRVNVANISKVYQLQYIINLGGGSPNSSFASASAVTGETCVRWKVVIERIGD